MSEMNAEPELTAAQVEAMDRVEDALQRAWEHAMAVDDELKNATHYSPWEIAQRLCAHMADPDCRAGTELYEALGYLRLAHEEAARPG